ncbi:MAG: molybdate transport system permease protein [Actinomycetota bacterium]|jgi:molybdate transport system permease protein
MRRHRPPALVVAVGALAIAFFALPLVGLFQRARWSTLSDDLTTTAALDALRLSVLCALAAAALSVLFGTPLAWLLARAQWPGRRVVRALVLLPMVLPPVVGGVALLAAFSLGSPIGGWLHDALDIQLTFSPAGVVMAQTFVAMPFYVITLEAALGSVDTRYEDAAASLGAGPLTVFRRVTLPLVAGSVAAGTVLAFARALGEFGATITFAGNIAGRTQTLPLDVYLALETDPHAAIALSFVLVAVSLAALVALRERWLIRT